MATTPFMCRLSIILYDMCTTQYMHVSLRLTAAAQHGLALNVNCDLNGFNQIVPCGLHGSKTGRLINWLPDVQMRDVHVLMKNSLEKHFGLLWTE